MASFPGSDVRPWRPGNWLRLNAAGDGFRPDRGQLAVTGAPFVAGPGEDAHGFVLKDYVAG